MARKLLIDTDPGIDDAMAIFYALNSPEFEVIGLTSIFGNAYTEICTQNALRLLEIADRTEIPVAAGADRPLTVEFKGPADFVHGANGQGNANLPAPKIQPINQSAAEFIVDQIKQHPGEVTLAPLGPLTNIALALLLDPTIVDDIHEIVLMGGNAFVPGNASPAAEANILNDPEAADIVFGMQCPITMVGLDVTEKVYMSPEVLDHITSFDNPESQHLAKILPFYHDFFTGRRGEPGIHVHDSTVISYLLDPALFTTVKHPIRVATSGISRGKTWPAVGLADVESPWSGRRDINICVDVNAAKVIEMELDRLK
ncbi:MAG: nucleoside hydrolase [Chloroflexi bacterium]|nr:MAG: nucleoside hydrolase [Chloroflexota bacterium]MBL1194585.1 nucleoside hydrolase [Chloroflexota bacterium]NOH11874.1 nucleoside hydrolase [Chloroflexota bacterium]